MYVTMYTDHGFSFWQTCGKVRSRNTTTQASAAVSPCITEGRLQVRITDLSLGLRRHYLGV